jgi:hypothetical protein
MDAILRQNGGLLPDREQTARSAKNFVYGG